MPKMGGSAGKPLFPSMPDDLLKEIKLLADKDENDDLYDLMDMILWELKDGKKRAEREKEIRHYFRKCSIWRKPIKRAWKENIWPWLKGDTNV